MSADCRSDCLTNASAKPDALVKVVSEGVLKHIDLHPPFGSLLKHKDYLTKWIHIICGPQAFFVRFTGEAHISSVR